MAVRVARGNRVSSRRGVLLLGSALGVSIAVLAAAVPNRALAADECGVAAPGATLTCTPGDYPAGIEYLGAEDLTVVLPTGTTVSGEAPSGAAVAVRGNGDLTLTAQEGSTILNNDGQGVWVDSYDGAAAITVDDVTAGHYGVDLYGATSATLTATGTVQTAGGYAVLAVSGGDVTVNTADVVVTGGLGGAGIFAFSNSTGGSVSVTSGAVEVSGTDASGIRAFAWREGSTITVNSGSVTSDADGIFAYSGEGGHSDIVIDSATVSTSGDEGRGIVATASYGDVSVSSGSVTTAGDDSEGILVKAAEGEVYVQSDSVHTAGDYSTGIKVEGGLGSVELHSGSIVTDGASASGIDVYTSTGAVDVTSDSVALTGGFATYEGEYGTYVGEIPVGIDVFSVNGAITVASGDVSVLDGVGIRTVSTGATSVTSTGTILVADGESGLYGEGLAGISVESRRIYSEGGSVAGGDIDVVNEGTIEIYGNNRTGVLVDGSGGTVTITNDGAINTHGAGSEGVNAHNRGEGDLTFANNGSIHTYGTNAAAIHVGDGGSLTVTNAGTITTEGDDAVGIRAHAGDGSIHITSTGAIETRGAFSAGVDVNTYGGAIDIDVASVSATGFGGVGVVAETNSGTINITAGTVTVSYACEEECLHFGEGGAGVLVRSDTGDVTVDVGGVTTHGDYVRGVAVAMYGYGEGEYAFGDIEVNTDSVVTSGDWATGIEVVSGVHPDDFGPFGPPPVTETGHVSIDSGTIVTHGVGSVGISVAGAPAEQVLDFWAGPMLDGGGAVNPFGLIMGPHFGTTGDIEVASGTITTDGDGALGVYASSGFTLGFYGEGEYAFSQPGGDVVVTSGSIETAGDGAIGIVGRALTGGVTIDSGVIETSGDSASGIIATSGGVVFTQVEVEPEFYTSVPTFVAGGLVDVASDKIYTSGESAAGVTVVGMGGGVHVDSGIIATGGDYANGIQIMALGGDVTVESDEIRALGAGASGILVSTANLEPSFEEGPAFVAGDVHITSGTIRTEGYSADGIAVFSGYAFFGEGEYGGGDVDVTSGAITTLGDYSAGIRVMAYGRYTYGEDESVAVHGDVTIHSGTVTTAGSYSDGINVYADIGAVNVTATGVATTGLSSRGVDITADYGDVVLSLGTVTTSGDRASEVVSHYDSETESTVYETIYGDASDGVRVRTNDGDVTINAQNVTVSGDQATGVLVDTEYGDVTLNLGSVKAQGEAGDAVHVYSYDGDIGVNVTGQVSSVNGAGVHAYAYYGGVEVNLAAGSKVHGGTVGVYAYSDTGTTITINGTVSADSGLAIDVKGLGAATIHNLSNTVIGGISLTDQDDLFDNTGTFQATIDSQFGEGVDLFDNTGLLQILPGSSTPGTIAFQGLETFDNAGVVDLANGHAGDVFDLSSATWNGLAGSTLELDVSSDSSDTLLINDATGVTTLVLHKVGSGAIGEQLDLVVSNSDETGDEFVLDGDNGFVSFVLSFDAATDTWSATGVADTEVFEPGRFLAGAQNFWNETGDAWSARMTELRDIGADRGEGVQGWVQAFGGEQSEDRGTERRTVDGLTSEVNLAYDQNYRGLQTGLDWTAGAGVVGLTLGFGDSEQRMASGNSAEFGGFNLGAYGGWNAGSFFVNGLVKADVYKTRLGLRSLNASIELDGRTWGAKAEAGWRVGGDGWFFEPSARLSWTDVDLDGFSAGPGSVEFGDASSLQGEAGVRIGSHWTNGLVDLVPYLGLFAVDEFDGENQTVFSIAGDSFRLTDEAAGAHGRVDFGVTAVTFHGLEGFVKGEALVGGDAEGYSARLGVRWRW